MSAFDSAASRRSLIARRRLPYAPPTGELTQPGGDRECRRSDSAASRRSLIALRRLPNAPQTSELTQTVGGTVSSPPFIERSFSFQHLRCDTLR